ncbi:HlyC/CorC family transporter [Bradymonadaceae bacterium TMQ3]|uniref:HlyC/CorC family transporter n=1 Tax=Lujinxingia sediminis TaxID=2480984 RepID=A0ABY0CTE6_9DELT|nr:hemolysin family protein [Lujinxingia sediminis]RDV38843.1 HlyC/CorC family transporter [Bradymonadaceae bacterium TMQ3]RVU44077.1 HlyC/CorC family transporter [Lujinxingia sediminis]TXC76385.1 HlyC/CorC family transporter [Bradymonadales bacterium TMQ1]
MDVVIAEVIGIIACLLGSAYFSGSETALTSLSEGQTERLIEEKGVGSLRLWRDKPLVVLTSILIGNNIFNITASALATDLAARLLGSTAASQWAIPVAVGAMTFLLLTFGEITPKTIARVRNQQLASVVMWPMRIPVALFAPATFFFNTLAAGVMRLVGGSVDERQPYATSEELQYMIDVGSREGQIPEDRERLLRSVFEFPDTVVREIMVPRTDMVAIPEETNLEEVLEVLMECGHSRIPVYRETIDDIVGLFYAKDVIQLMASRQDFELSKLLRRTYFVPATKRIADLLAEFQINRIHMAVVVDEFGGTAGLITLEDIIEEFFGDIQDEYDTEPAQIIAIDEARVMADARVPIYDLEEYYDMELPEHPDYESLGGFILSQSGSVPEAGDEIVWNDLVFRVIEADAKRIISVEIERRSAEQDASEELVS